MKIKRRAALFAAWMLALSAVIIIGTVQTATAAPPGGYHAVAPARILDTRAPIGVGVAGPLGPGATISLQVAGRGGVPATGALAVVMNVTAVDPTVGGYLTLTPTGEIRGTVSNVNFVAGEIRPNLVTVKLGTTGAVDVYNDTGATHVLADVVGWYDNGTTAGGRFNALTPFRDLDTRSGIGRAGTAPVGPGTAFDVKVTGVGGVPAANVSAVVLNVTVTEPDSKSFVTVYPQGTSPRPNASNLNFTTGKQIANLVIVGVSASGAVTFYNDTGNTHILADVVGWFDANGTQGAFFHPVTPGRVLDSRPSHVGLFHEVEGAATIVGTAGIPATGVTAVVANFTAVDATFPGYLTIWPDGVGRPNASSINFPARLPTPNLVITSVNAKGDIALFASMVPSPDAYVDLVMDAFGYFSAT